MSQSDGLFDCSCHRVTDCSHQRLARFVRACVTGVSSRARAKVDAVTVVGPGGTAIEEGQPLDFVVIIELGEGELVAVRPEVLM